MLNRESGQTIVEYVIILGLLALVGFAGLRGIGSGVKDNADAIGENLRGESDFDWGDEGGSGAGEVEEGGDGSGGGHDDEADYEEVEFEEVDDSHLKLKRLENMTYRSDLKGPAIEYKNGTELEKVGDWYVVDIPTKIYVKKGYTYVYVRDEDGDVEYDPEIFDEKYVEDITPLFSWVKLEGKVKLNMDKRNKVKDVNFLVEYMKDLKVIDISDFHTHHVEDFGQMFSSCSNLEEIRGLEKLDTRSAKDMGSMFSNCWNLKTLDVSNFKTRNVETMRFMFKGCRSLEELDVSNFDTRNVKDMVCMFDDCSGLEELDLSNFNTGNVVDMYYMFNSCSNLKRLDVSNFDTSNVDRMSSMFNQVSSLESLDLSSFDTSKTKDMNSMFNKTLSLEYLDIRNFDTSGAEDLTYMFHSAGRDAGKDMKFIIGKDFKRHSGVKSWSMYTDANESIKRALKGEF